ncbi:tRNA glutamyl-Q(34) synthetase GluQRS [Janthinobacterium sp.]|uniref:tRNA glutamyl-Q(34) synthetase GluQRS n=1 Tax=Janthinobacterium sp. TaxID=1871054 RepID=UPI00293D803B|nr:tRNA glutamyl-Q(34) synthetase GluQRS [Janthinobacterium sp.]
MTPGPTHYTGRFAPSPTGALHQGSLVAALASYLDAKVHGGRWLVRIEDLDWDRNVHGADAAILASLQRCGMHWDGEVLRQSARLALYEAAARRLREALYPCACSRRETLGASVYPGTCRDGMAPGRTARALRLRLPPRRLVHFEDRWHGAHSQDVSAAVGDFIVRRADGFWAYQLAVVVDDAAQGVDHVVRGADLLDSTPRQIHLQELLGLARPAYLHVPVVTNAAGEKLSKQSGALAFDGGAAPAALLHAALLPAARFLGMDIRATSLDAFWRRAVPAWGKLLQLRAEAIKNPPRRGAGAGSLQRRG